MRAWRICVVAFVLAVPPLQGRAASLIPIADLPGEYMASFLKKFSEACIENMGGSDFGMKYCYCAGAFLTEKFTVDEAADTRIMGTLEGMERAHPGTKHRLESCAKAAKPGD